MHITSLLTVVASLVTVALAGTCNHDNCYRALERYQESTSSSFCKQYLKTSTKTAPSGIATCGSSRISSACSCLTTTTPPPVTTTSTFATSKTSAPKTTTAPPKTTTLSSVTTTAPASFPFPTSTCTGRLLSTAGCPTPYDHCCQYVCEEAQVPYDVCSLTNGSGEFAVCSSCPSPAPT